jgi:poly(hydroxyalkanoate) depolymerase family esterase
MRIPRGVAVLLMAGAAGTACATAGVLPPSPAGTSRGAYQWRGQERSYLVHRPAAGARRGSLVVVLHGCTQDGADAARGTRFDDWADREGFTVLYPEQPARAHAQRCWNWYQPEAMDPERGELGLVAALVDSIARRDEVPAARIALVGMSAGAALAGQLAIAHPSRYGALALHSGVPSAAATSLAAALALMGRGPADADSLGAATHRAMGRGARAIPVLVIHGGADRLAAPANLEGIARQWVVANAAAGQVPARAGTVVTTPRAPATAGHALHGMRVDDARGRPSVEWWRVEALAHAWSGGAATGSYTAPAAPDATAMIVSFLNELWTAR